MSSYYNENDPYAAQWLRNLTAAGHIARGDVDERSILDVRAGDLRGYTQCHFFAGIGGWSYALRLAGWPDDRPVWTGSCPCQPFSTAGKGKAADDGRHLWPAWFSLVAECCPAIILGEQVEAAVGWGWLDAVFADLEGEGYACGATVLPACGVGAPHIRQRLWFVADSSGARAGRHAGNAQCAPPQSEGEGSKDRRNIAGRSVTLRPANELADSMSAGRPKGRPIAGNRPITSLCGAGELGNADKPGSQGRRLDTGEHAGQCTAGAASPGHDCDWLPCTDGKARPVEPGTFPLAHGIPGRVGRLRAYGNAIVPQAAAAFIEGVM